MSVHLINVTYKGGKVVRHVALTGAGHHTNESLEEHITNNPAMFPEAEQIELEDITDTPEGRLVASQGVSAITEKIKAGQARKLTPNLAKKPPIFKKTKPSLAPEKQGLVENTINHEGRSTATETARAAAAAAEAPETEPVVDLASPSVLSPAFPPSAPPTPAKAVPAPAAATVPVSSPASAPTQPKTA